MSSPSSSKRVVLRRYLVKFHGLMGISIGSVLMLIGLSGAMLAFKSELLDHFNPGIRRVAPRAEAVLTPDKLLAVLAPLPAEKSIQTLVFSIEPGQSVEVLLRKSDALGAAPVYVDPYTGAWLGSARGHSFFDWTERLHRFLLLPREVGRPVSGTIALVLLLLVFSGVYLRWPRHPWRLSGWIGFKRHLRGRAYWWNLHGVVATWAIPAWLLLAATGIYWSFDSVRTTIDGWAGVERTRRMLPEAAAALPWPDLAPAWQSFVAANVAWSTLRVRLPDREGGLTEWQWTAVDADHERQRSQMLIRLDGHVEKDLRFAGLSPARRVVAAIYPLHMGTYFGLPGRWVMVLAALALPVIGVSGWILYLQRRRQRHPVSGTAGLTRQV